MSDVIKGFPSVNLSITNPNIKKKDALDRNTPFSFLDFVKNVRETYEPEGLQEYYTSYINKWNTKAVNKTLNNKETIIDRYKDFLRDITLNFSTHAEKTFLTQIDFNDKYDLEIAMSFFSKKIREIVTYYSNKRDDLYLTTTRHKVRGSNYGVEQTTYELVLNYLENRSTANTDYNIDVIKDDLAITITEYFDNFSQYFNQPPDENYYGKNFKGYLDLDLDKPEDNIFLNNDKDIVEKVFSGLSNELKDLKEVNFNPILSASPLFNAKRKQTEKFIGTDFYYLSSNSRLQSLSGKLIQAQSPGSNFLNQDFPTVASVFSNDLISERNQGFFKPSNTGIISIESKRLRFFQTGQLEPDKLYIFPDPEIFTNDQEIFTFIIDTSRSINNSSKGIAVNQPNTDKHSTSFLGYNSEIGQGTNLNTDLSYLYDEGYIHQGKQDLLGNIFGLVKDNNYYRNNLVTLPSLTIKNLIFNGYQFYDTLYGEGLEFNYGTTDSSSYSETIRSGLTGFTDGLALTGWNHLSAYNMFFRYFCPYQELIKPTDWLGVDFPRPEGYTINADVKEGAYFKFSDDEALSEPIRTGLSSFTDSALQFYFSELIEAGIGYYDNASTVVRALCDDTGPGTAYVPGIALYGGLSGDFTYSVRQSGDNGVKNYDGGLFTDNIIFDYTPGNERFDYRDEVYDTTVITTATTAAESFFDKRDHTGKIYVKNISLAPGDPNVKELTDTLTYLASKHSNTIGHQLSTSVVNFDIIYDTLFIETSDYLVIEKTETENNYFVSPNTSAISLSGNTNFFQKFSNRFRVDNSVFYCRMKQEQIDFKDIKIYPEIYKYDYIKETNERVFPIASINTVSDTCFNILSTDVVFLECSTPHLTYSSDNNRFNLGFLLKDQNQGISLLNYQFEYTNKINFLTTEKYDCNDYRYTYNFINANTTINLTDLYFSLSSQTPILSSQGVPGVTSSPFKTALIL